MTVLWVTRQAPTRSAQSPQSRTLTTEVSASLAELAAVVGRAAEGGVASVTASTELPPLSTALAGVRTC